MNGAKMKKTFTERLNDWRSWAALVALVIGFWGFAPSVGLDLPRWTWLAEHRALADEVNRNHIQSLELHVNSLELQIIDLEIAIARLKREGAETELLERKKALLIQTVEPLKAQLKSARGW
jgi:hypothetical protein